MRRSAAVAFVLSAAGLGLALSGCAGGAPLLHPAKVLPPGKVSLGAGVSGQFGLLDQEAKSPTDKSAPLLDDFTVAPGVAPWAAGRVGIEYDFEAGLTYTGRAVRVDARHAFDLKPLTMSLGLGATALLPKRRDNDAGSAYGGGGDIPLIFGWSSDADLYSIWFGPRIGFEILGGRVLGSEYSVGGSTDRFSSLSGQHIYMGGLVGMRVGFRHFHVAIELDGSYHIAHGTFGDVDVTAHDVSLTPTGALILTF